MKVVAEAEKIAVSSVIGLSRLVANFKFSGVNHTASQSEVLTEFQVLGERQEM